MFVKMVVMRMVRMMKMEMKEVMRVIFRCLGDFAS